jgi:hypothetical protein
MQGAAMVPSPVLMADIRRMIETGAHPPTNRTASMGSKFRQGRQLLASEAMRILRSLLVFRPRCN